MSICRVEKTQNYTVMSNHHLRDMNLSLKAIGLLSKVLSLPEDWNYSVEGLTSICKENRTAIDTALKELQLNGYLVVTKHMPGTIDSRTNKVFSRIEYEYVFYEQPQEIQDIENLVVENQEQLNKEIPNTEVLNKDILKGAEESSVSESTFSYDTKSSRPKRNYTAKPIIDMPEENKKLTRQQKHQMKIKELLEVVPRDYGQELINVLGEYLDMRINLHIGKIDREWFQKEWDENIYPALEKYPLDEVVRCLRTVVIPKNYKRCFINISTYNKPQFNDNGKYTATELNRAEIEGRLAIENAKQNGTFQYEF